MNDQPKPIALNLMEIWRTGRQLEQPNVVWRAVNRDHSPASEWRPMNPSFAKKALRSGVFSCNHEGAQVLFAAREFPGARAQLSDYGRLKELIAARKAGKALEPFNAGEPQPITATDLQAMENPEPLPEGGDGDVKPEQLDAAADSVIADITGGAVGADGVTNGDSPTPKSDEVAGLSTDGGVSIPSVGNTADATTEATHDEQRSDGGRESDRGSEVQSDG